MKKIMRPLIIIALLCIPIIYSFFYLYAFWDPYGKTNNIPIAIVNLDNGQEDENLGEELVQKIVDKDILEVNKLDENTAKEKLENREVYAVITIPEDFTEKLNNAENSDRETTTITYSTNKKSNYLASQIISTMVTNVELELHKETTEKIVDKLVEQLNAVPDDLSKISDATEEIKNGTANLTEGTEKINEGASTLDKNYKEFDTGVNSVTEGSKTLENGIITLDNGIEEVYNGSKDLGTSLEELNQLVGAIGTLKEGANTLNNGAMEYSESSKLFYENIDMLIKSIVTYGEANSEILALDPNIAKIYQVAKSINESNSIQSLTSASENLVAGTESLNSGIEKINSSTSRLPELEAGIERMQGALGKITEGSKIARSGISDLSSGLDTLKENSTKIREGISELNNGTSSALEGSQQLLEGVTTFDNEIDESIVDTKNELEKLDGLSEYSKEPVEIEEETYGGEVDKYGIVFAPYFMSLSLWVGALVLFVVLYYDSENRFKLLGKNAKNKILRAFLYLVLAIAQALILGFLLKHLLGFTVTNEWGYYLSCILISTVFVSIVQFLIVNFNDVGKFLAILLLVFQLTASGGTFPMETTPEFFQTIYAFMPMHYSVDLIKEMLISIDGNIIAQSVGVLGGFLVTTIILTLLIDIIKLVKRFIIKKKEARKGMRS